MSANSQAAFSLMWLTGKMTSLSGKLVASIFVAFVTGSSACSSDQQSAGSTESTEATQRTQETRATEAADDKSTENVESDANSARPEQASELVSKMLTSISDGYRKVDGVWAGFVPNEHPVVIPIKEGNEVEGVLLLNHPDADAVGSATTLQIDGTVFETAHYVTDLADAARIKQVRAFDFNTEIGGVDSFVMIADSSDDFFDPTTKDYVSTLLHEMFHRYQNESFSGSVAFQDVEGYDYSAANIELATLETRALKAALETSDVTERQVAARHFGAIRAFRLEQDGRVKLDNSQERLEGTARYLEHAMAGKDREFVYHGENFGAEMFVNPAVVGGIKDWYGFGRWYSSGAAVIHLLKQLGAESVESRIEDGETPWDLLVDELGIAGNEAQLVADARTAYDPQNSLRALADEAAEQAKTEPLVFGSQDFGGPQDSDKPEDGEGQQITEEEIACLEEQGFGFGSDEEITEAQEEACFA